MNNKVPGRLALTLIALLFQLAPATAQVSIRAKSRDDGGSSLVDPPKLVVGIVVDQMRFDYLTRYWDHYGEGGFRRLVGEGFLGRNHHFNYLPTKTAPGHASIYTGATPSVHGILGNEWYDKPSEAEVYCVDDATAEPVGTAGPDGRKSPHRLLVTTLTDQLELHTQRRSKVVAISLKDRGSVLPAGHLADAAYWYEDHTGHWISSSYYMDQLPQWVQAFNNSGAANKYKIPWETLEPIGTYVESGPDYNTYEDTFVGESSPVFPHDIPGLWDANGGYKMIRYSPFGNSLTVDFALEALEEEELGMDPWTDFLSISFSSTDHVGHDYGVNSKEVQDTYIRLDRDLERLLRQLDRKVGEGNYTLFLSADHGAGQVSTYLADLKVPGSYFSFDAFRGELDEFITFTYGVDALIKYIINNQIFLDHDLIRNLGLEPGEVQRKLADEILGYEGIETVYTASEMHLGSAEDGLAALLRNGYNQKRSGDILYVTASGRTDYRTGSDHGSPFNYDTHVPLILFGKGIRQGSLTRRTQITDIAPTLSVLLGIAFPSGSTGEPITEALD